MEAFFFGEHNSKLFGAYHQPVVTHDRKIGVILCYPFGNEYIRAHLAFFEFAKKLSLNGFHTLRFDYSGTGDSFGDENIHSLNRWVNDIEKAVDELRDGGGIKKVIIIGLRLGASLAALLASQKKVDFLVMWAPVIDGEAYLKELKGIQLFYIKNWLKGSFNKFNLGKNFECMGFKTSHELIYDIQKLNLSQLQISNNRLLILANNSNINTELSDFINNLTRDNNSYEIMEIKDENFWFKYADEMEKSVVPVRDIDNIISHLNTVFS